MKYEAGEYADDVAFKSAQKAVPKLWPFIKGYSDHVQSKLLVADARLRKSKVAILDSGIMHVAPMSEPGTQQESSGSYITGKQGESMWSLWPRVRKGKSFVDENNRIRPWLIASDPHGTQMANLICSIDPHCELYVAKVTETRQGVETSRVSNASDRFSLRFPYSPCSAGPL